MRGPAFLLQKLKEATEDGHTHRGLASFDF
jgi:hypothetical protein